MSGFSGSLTPVLLNRATGSIKEAMPSAKSLLPTVSAPPEPMPAKTVAPSEPVPKPVYPKENRQTKQWAAAAILAVVVAGAVGIAWRTLLPGSVESCAAEQVKVAGQCVAVPANLPERFSSGERVLFSDTNLDLENGVQTFAQGDYSGL